MVKKQIIINPKKGKDEQLKLFANFEVKESHCKWLYAVGIPRKTIIANIEEYLYQIDEGKITSLSIKMNKDNEFVIRAGIPKN